MQALHRDLDLFKKAKAAAEERVAALSTENGVLKV